MFSGLLDEAGDVVVKHHERGEVTQHGQRQRRASFWITEDPHLSFVATVQRTPWYLAKCSTARKSRGFSFDDSSRRWSQSLMVRFHMGTAGSSTRLFVERPEKLLRESTLFQGTVAEECLVQRAKILRFAAICQFLEKWEI